MSDHGIHLPSSDPEVSEPDLTEIRRQLAARRPSFSPSRFDDTAFNDFKLKARVQSESSVMAKAIPIIAGNASISNEHNLNFTNAETMTGDLTPTPDFFDGAPPDALHRCLREDLSKLVVPTKHANVPVTPNFFLEAKSFKGDAAVAQRQACLDGAYGARAMHSLQSYREKTRTYNGDIHTYSSTYHAGLLVLYGHYVKAPTHPATQPVYGMTEIIGQYMTGNRAGFVEGATAFRNARDLAQRHRDELIQSANKKARRANPPLFDDEPAATGQREAGLDESVDRAERVAPDVAVADEDAADLPRSLPSGDELAHEPGPDAVEPTTSLARRATPVNGQLSSARSKRNRVSGSPPSETTQLHKKQSLA